MAEEKKECSGKEIPKGEQPSIDKCASECEGVASMFAFGTNDFGNNRCSGNGCMCLCETSATKEGTCTSVNHKGYRLYKYGLADSKGDYHKLHKCYGSYILLVT